MRKTIIIGLAIGASLPGSGILAQEDGTGLPSLVIEVAVDSLRDVALAVYAPARGVIYYSPSLQRQLGPELTAFFRAHEFGHLYHHHTSANALVGAPASPDSLLQERELEADCYAAHELIGSNRPAVNAALRFFSRLGSVRFDAEHPTGAQRAAHILSCIPEGPAS